MREASNITLAASAAYHRQADGQAERTMQTILYALRATLGSRLDQTIMGGPTPPRRSLPQHFKPRHS
jgi:hypothetical protein